MSELPPPPPSSEPPPPAPPPFQPPPGYLPPPPSYPAPGMPGQARPPILPAAIGVGGIGMMSQFNRDALWSIGIGVVSVVVPFTLGFVFFFLPFIGIYYGYRAIRRGSVIGGVVGIVLCVIGGILTILSRVVH